MVHRRIVVRIDCCGHDTDRAGDWFVPFWPDAPVVLLYAGIGTSITGLIVRVPALVYSPLVAFVVAVYMLMILTNGGSVAPEWNLYFGFSFLLMMVIPGHLLNKKAAAYAC